MRWEGGGAHQAVLHLEGGEMGRGRGSPGSTSLGEGVRWEGASPGSTSLDRKGEGRAILHLEGGRWEGGGAKSTSLGEGVSGKGEGLTRQYFTGGGLTRQYFTWRGGEMLTRQYFTWRGVRWEGGGVNQAVLHLEGGEMGRGRGSPGSTSLGDHQAVLHLERG